MNGSIHSRPLQGPFTTSAEQEGGIVAAAARIQVYPSALPGQQVPANRRWDTTNHLAPEIRDGGIPAANHQVKSAGVWSA
jgi:hypothetical protein